VSDLKINVPDTLVSFVLVALSFVAVFFLAMLQVGQLIWGKRSEEKIVSDPVLLKDQNILCIVHEYRVKSRS